jgi:tetrahydromethanopterin S-methyltransferase subunit C
MLATVVTQLAVPWLLVRVVAELVPPAQHGRAVARYGLAVGLPQLGLLAAGVAVVEQLGFAVVFVAAGHHRRAPRSARSWPCSPARSRRAG